MSNPARFRKIAIDGLWRNNPALVALLGLCPLLAVSNTIINSLGLGLATTTTMIFSSGTVSLLRYHIAKEVRLPLFVLIIAASVTVIELLMNAYFHELFRLLGIFIPLIVTNCAIIGRAEVFASKNPFGLAVLDALFMGLGFTAVLVVLGTLREGIGTGTLFSHAELIFGPAAKIWRLSLWADDRGCLVAILPPGAFIGLGLLVAAKNAIGAKTSARREVRLGVIPSTRSDG